ncbi:MAG: phosphoribosylformylglycinamidine synthase [Oscillospiraceae bacterium]|nr:phosphoribosylformylglycinamidine synthase [Oscillospiraceae bacterium]
MVYRVFVEKKEAFAQEAEALCRELTEFLEVRSLVRLRILNRYDAEEISLERFRAAIPTVFSEPQVDTAAESVDLRDADAVFAVEFLPGQFDQRADSAAQCVQLMFQSERPLIRSAKVYALYGTLSEEDVSKVKRYVINPVEAREASLALPDTLRTNYDIPSTVKTIEGFRNCSEEELSDMLRTYGLAMDKDDLAFCQRYFREEDRDPTVTELRMIDTYWSDHCRHTTFHTVIDQVSFEDPELQNTYEDYLYLRERLGRTKSPCLMDLATIAARYLKQTGRLDKLDESEEINACTVKMDVEVDGKREPWLLLFKNETHNHPTEIEPFGGAATCIGGAIRDPLSGRAYVYGAMRLTGAADPRAAVSETIPGKLPQRKLVTTAAAGYSSYGNQIGLATGLVEEIYHPGYAAKRMEIGAVIAAAPQANVRRERPAPGDVVILIGGSTGRDGIGGATGSSKAHTAHSVETCGAEVQKGNAPEERKLQRLFRNPEAARLIKRCNDFGAGGVSVAIGELAEGLRIDLNAVPRKYEGLDGTELAISESQERMAVVVASEDANRFLTLAQAENLQACVVAAVTETPRLVMDWNGKQIVDISRAFLDSNGAEKHITIETVSPELKPDIPVIDFRSACEAVADDLNLCSHRGLSERFDASIGAGTVLMPFGGRRQLTPIQAMVHKISLESGSTDDCSLMAWGFNPQISEQSPYHGAYLAVVDSVSKLVASGASFRDVYLSFQEYFEKPGRDPKRWGKPLSALLGAFRAQMDLGIAAIGGKDSMSGSFEKLDVPPTLVSFAVTTDQTKHILSPEFKKAGNAAYLLAPERDANGLPKPASLLELFDRLTALQRTGKVLSCWAIGLGGVLEAVLKMAFGNGLGFHFAEDFGLSDLRKLQYGSILVEATEPLEDAAFIGNVTTENVFRLGSECVEGESLCRRWENCLESVYPTGMDRPVEHYSALRYETSGRISPAVRCAKPRVLIPVFPGTNCEYDSARAVLEAGATPEILIVNNLSADGIRRSVDKFAAALKDAQIVFIPGGFSGGDEPDGSGKFITAFFRNAAIREGVADLLERRDGLMLGICNGFQALIKLGLVPYGRIVDADENSPTLTYNTIGRHQSRIVQTRIVSDKSPWFSGLRVGEIVNVPISHGEGRFIASETLLRELIENGQIATQYVDLEGIPTSELRFNPNGSVMAVEGITSPDGRVLGKMGHSERIGPGLYKNVPGSFESHLFTSAVKYFHGS